MPDKGHKMTDDMIKELEDKLHELYTKADSDLQKKAASRLKTYNEMVKVKEKTLDDKAFKEWKKNQAYILSNQKSLIDTIADDLVKTDQIALDIINDHTPKAYALNYNYGTYQVEDAGKINTSFALYNHETVELLSLYDDSSLLPEKKDLDIPKDLQWNKKHLSQAIAQGVLQGESIDKIAKRLSAAVGMDENGAIRNARTMMTAAQNGGRVDAYLRGKSMGIELQQKWRATEDSRTRKSHRAIDGEVVEVGEIFSNKCHFPGDPTGPGREVYNCRCTLLPLVNGIKDFNPLSDDKYIKKGFEEWLEDQADPYITAKFGGKAMSVVYQELKDLKGSKIGNDFYYKILQPAGKPSKVWKEYINGTLDAANTKKIDDYLLKHFDLNAGKLDDVAKTADKIDDISDAAKAAESKLNIKKGSPMSTKDADNYSVNPLYNVDDVATTKNCQTSAFVYECRKQGYDVVALPKMVDSNNTPLKDFKAIGEKQKELAKNQSSGWINKKTGKAPEIELGNSIDYVMTKNEWITELEKHIGNNGERYTLSVRWKSGGGHVVNIDRDKNGKLRIIDNQKGFGEKNTWTDKELEDYFANKQVKNIKAIYRVDDCVPNPEYFNTIVIDAKKMKPYVHFNALPIDDQAVIAKKAMVKNIDTEVYYNKWRFGMIDDSDLDKLFNVKIDPTDGVDKQLIFDAHGKKSLNKVYTGLKDEFGSTVANDFYYKVMQPIGPASGTWKKYLAGELDDISTKKIDDYLLKYLPGKGKADDIAKSVKTANKASGVTKASKTISNTKKADNGGSVTSEALDAEAFKNKSASAVWKELNANKMGGGKFWTDITNIGKTKSIKPAEVWKKYLAGELDSKDIDTIEKHLAKLYSKKADDVKDAAKTAKAVTKTFDKDLVKNKAVSSFYSEWKKEGNTALAGQWWKTIGDIGKNYGLEKKQSKVWELYKTGQLKDDEVKKIEDFLTKNYFNKSDNVIDYSKYGGKEVYDLLKNYDNYEAFILSPASEFGKIMKAFNNDGDKVKAAINEIKKAKITKTTTKSDDLIKAEAKLEKAKKELKDNVDMTQTWASIWKDDVTLADYEAKKSTIKAKKIYYEDELDKLHSDPSYKSWMSEEDKQFLIWKYEKLSDDLEEYEEKGEEYLKYKKAIDKAQNKVNELSPSQFSKNYSQERKDAALYIRGSSSEIREEANKHFAAQSKKEFKAAKKIESDAIKEYTSSYHKFNEPLRGIEYGTSKVKGVGNVDLNAGYANNGKKLNAMTDYLEKTNWSEDIWLQRGCGWGGMDNFLQVDMSLLQNGTEEKLRQALLGKTVTEYGFMSAGTGRGAGFSGNIIFNIFLPKGAKASYAEVYSYYKNGSEIETIIQQGAQFTVTRIDKSGGTWFIDLELSGYLPPQRYTP